VQAAANGVVAAMTRIGHVYALGVERNAAPWRRKATLLGDGDVQAMLGATHHLGASAERDPATALAWLVKARRRRCGFVDRCYDGVGNSCKSERRRVAERRACLPVGSEEPSP
jgi:hypothetical protein